MTAVRPVERARWPSFWKVEGLGNDFVLVDLRSRPDAANVATRLAAATPELCDRHRGVGADGVLLVLDAPDGVRMRVVNHDGSVPEMCGNGLRCVALYVALADGLRLPADVYVATDAGPRPCTVLTADGMRGTVRADMGTARTEGSVTPQAAEGRTAIAVDVGNPHAVFVCDPGTDLAELARRLGPAIERDPAFPSGTNVEFATLDAQGEDGAVVTCVVWERGCGLTQACGTGACATAAALAARTAITRFEVRLPGGPLAVSVGPAHRVAAEGPARLVFHGRHPTADPNTAP